MTRPEIVTALFDGAVKIAAQSLRQEKEGREYLATSSFELAQRMLRLATRIEVGEDIIE